MTMEIGSVVHSTMNTPGETMGIINPLLCHYHLDTFTLVKVLNCVDRRKEEPAQQKLIVTQSQLAHPTVATQLSFSLFFKSQNPF